MKFSIFQQAVEKQFKKMTANGETLFVVDFDKDEIYYNVYLPSFPEGTNPIHRERTVHDCNCCKTFIRRMGGVVSINADLSISSIWDIEVEGYYQEVANAMSAYVKSLDIRNQFMSDEKKIGNKMNIELTDSGQTVEHEHFFIELPKQYVLPHGKSYGDFAGGKLADSQVLERSLREFNLEAIHIVSDLIEQNSLYRGTEKRQLVNTIKQYKIDYTVLVTQNKSNFIWSLAAKLKGAARFRNDVIGTLIADISEGVELEKAVKSFESKVAPTNYKRTTSLITQSMITSAEATVTELGLENSLQRRFANVHDITINNVLFADRAAKEQMGVLGLSPTKSSIPKTDKIEEIAIDDFISKVLPKVDSIEMQVANNQVNNLMSVVAPVDADSNNMLKWDNNFSWSYNGEVTDGIKERVKTAGGSVTGELRFSLAWYNGDDLDLSVIEPSGNAIYFSSKKGASGGLLDVDMNAGGPSNKTDPVENITWNRLSTMIEGNYKVIVHNYSKRSTSNVGFELELDIKGATQLIKHPDALPDGKKVTVLHFNYSKSKGVVITKSMESTTSSEEVWGVNTNEWTKVSMIMNSPNHWDNCETGNKHVFFILDGCLNPEPARGFYNEFLNGSLVKHRKVFEVLSSKFKAEHTKEQLSGLGFSSTQRNSVVVRVKGSFNRVLKVNF